MDLGEGQVIDMSTLQNETHEPLAETCGQKAMDKQLPAGRQYLERRRR
jgi:hypothetical protein